MSFSSPGYLALLALAPLSALAYLLLDRWRRRALARFAPGQDAREVSAAVGSGGRAVKAALVVLAVAALAVALARPRLGEHEVVVRQEGANVVIALDVSRSMFAGDVEPSRLGLAQRETVVLLDRLRGHRVGLVLFARSAILRSPITTDMRPVRELVLSAAEANVLVAPGSDLGGAVRTAMRALEAGDAESKAIVLVTDGEDHESEALAAAREAGRAGIVLFIAGVGTEAGALVPVIDSETGLPVSGQEVREPPVVTRLNEGLLRRMAAATSQGDYLPGDRLADLAGAIDGLDRTSFDVERQLQPIERFQWVALIALVALVLEALLPQRRLRLRPAFRLPRLMPRAAHLSVLVLAALLAGACSSAVGGLITEGNDAYERGDYEAALEAYRRAAAIAPDRQEPHLNAGLALHQLERYQEASDETVRALPIDDPLEAGRVHYNLGNHYFRLGRFPEALESYREALLLNPRDRDAKHNLELALQVVSRLQEQESPPSSGDRVDGAGTPGDGEGSALQPIEDTGDESDAGERVVQATEAVQRSLEDALAGIEDEFTVAEALRALDLAQELNRLLPLVERRGSAGSPDRPDY